jgi:uncharacterized membrane protein
MTFGQRMAARAAQIVGSWPFIIIQAMSLAGWIVVNSINSIHPFDPKPYILLNLVLSFQAAFTGPVLLIAANVGAAIDRKQINRIESLEATVETHVEQTEKGIAELKASMAVLLERSAP